jgi:hypothetical protein
MGQKYFMRSVELVITGFESGRRGLLSKECKTPLGNRKGKDTDSPLEPPIS